MMFYYSLFFSYVFLQLMVLVGVIFITLMERKLLASFMIRLGPNYVFYGGYLQSISDALKLFFKEMINCYLLNFNIFYLSPVLSMFFCLLFWLMYPFYEGGVFFMFSILYFICLSGLSVYPILMMGWSSNCKYSILGSLRSVAQMLSYELSFILILLILFLINKSLNLIIVSLNCVYIYNFFFLFPVFYIFFISFLAELNRTPYDFSEGESELVSGFNTEYGSSGFTLIFLSEYVMIIFMSFIVSFFFFNVKVLDVLSVFKMCFFIFFVIWIRATLPRYRYDMLMNLAWKSFLPLSLSFLVFYIVVFYFFNL